MMKSRKNVIIFGNKDLSELANFYLNNDKYYKEKYWVKGFTLNKEFKTVDKFQNKIIWDWETLEQNYPPSCDNILFAPIIDNFLREKIYNEGKQKGYDFLSFISSKCTNLSNSIGENCFIQEDNTIQPFTTIGNNVILWAGNHIGHHSTIEDNVFFTSHVVMSGHCHIKKNAYLGVNSTLRDGITIGENSIIGMGSVVTKSVPNNQTWIGNPAKLKQ